MRRAVLAALAGSAVLAGFAVAALPFSHGLFRAPRAPYGESAAAFTAPAWILLERAESLIPRDASVVARVEPPDANTDMFLHRFAVALLPGRKIVPAALWGIPTPSDLQAEAEYEVVVGKKPQSSPGQLLLEIPEGTVWRIGR